MIMINTLGYTFGYTLTKYTADLIYKVGSSPNPFALIPSPSADLTITENFFEDFNKRLTPFY